MLSYIFLPKKLYTWIERPFSYPFCRSNVTYVVAGLGYKLTILSERVVDGTILSDWPCDCVAIKRIKDSIGRIRLNETNLLLLFEK